MKKYFVKATQQAMEHAKKCFPEEACGFVVKDAFLPCENIAEDPTKDFRIDPYTYLIQEKKAHIQAIIHSHDDYPHASKKDMMSQIATSVPWGVINLKGGAVQDVFWWGDQLPIQDLLERPFYHGVYDCYALVRDYWRMQSIALPNVAREFEWWDNGENVLVDGVGEAARRINVKELQEGDVIFFQVRADVPNHSAIYLGNGLMLHHLYNRLSRREPVGSWIKYATHFLRVNK